MTDITADLAVELQPPMANGEVIFEQPWQGRVFGMAVSLSAAGAFEWAEFQQVLIEVIGDWDGWVAGRETELIADYQYYEHFAEALNRLLALKGLVSQQAVDARVSQFTARPHGHDHKHHHS